MKYEIIYNAEVENWDNGCPILSVDKDDFQKAKKEDLKAFLDFFNRIVVAEPYNVSEEVFNKLYIAMKMWLPMKEGKRFLFGGNSILNVLKKTKETPNLFKFLPQKYWVEIAYQFEDEHLEPVYFKKAAVEVKQTQKGLGLLYNFQETICTPKFKIDENGCSFASRE